MARRVDRSTSTDVATVEELLHPLAALLLPTGDVDNPRWRRGWLRHRDEAMRMARAETKAAGRHHWGGRPIFYWMFDLGVVEPIGDDAERLRLLVEDGELQPWEADRIRRLAAEAAERVGTGGEQYGPDFFPDRDAVALGELLKEMSSADRRIGLTRAHPRADRAYSWPASRPYQTCRFDGRCVRAANRGP